MSDLTIYTVAWIYAIGTELVAAKQFLDETHDAADQLPANDDNAYVLGKVGKHNVVIAALPYGQYGLVSAAIVARDMARSFPNLRFVLMVGIGGGAPSQRHDIRLGDIVVSSPDSGVGGVLQYDFGKTVQDESFKVTGHLNQSPQCLLRAIPLLEADYESDGNGIETRIANILETKPRLRAKYRKPESSTDRLFSSVYKHTGDKDQECTAICDATHLVERPKRSEEQDSPTIHYGTIASANQLMKDANLRDKLSAENDVLCFEMEAAGLMNHFPCLVVRGICDYSDTHKNKQWQGYAAMAAAAYTKDLLKRISPNRVEAERKLAQVLYDIGTEVAKTKLAIRDQTRQQERRDQDDKDKQCLRDLLVTNPRDDKRRIEETKGGLFEGSYSWILTHDDFNQFRNDQQNRLLWIKGDPGKGKTMLLCGIIDHIKNLTAQRRVLSYFFCQATDERINNATAVLRGLIFMLLNHDASLMPYIRKKYDIAGKPLFEDTNAWSALSEIFVGILQDTKLQGVCLVVDALDECVQGLPQLLDLIVQTSRFPHTKWLVSSRNWVEIEEKLCDVAHRLSLELNAKSVSAAVESFIEFKVSELTRLKGYQKNTADDVRRYLSVNANNTFLWVSLVCQKLRKVRPRHTQDTLKSFPPGLDSLYKRIMEYISNSEDAEACYEILALASTVYRPVSVDELQGLARSIENLSQEEVLEVIAACGSFLTLRDNIVFFVHQSVKDFLLEKATHKILSSGIEDQHFKIFKNSLKLLGDSLMRDIYDLRNPGYPIDKVKIPSPDPLAGMRYSCVHWVDHLQDAGVVIQAGMRGKSVVTDTMRFLKTNYLYWLEALSLIHSIPEGVKAMQKLEKVLTRNTSEELQNLANDARRFLLSQKGGIELAPLQTYTSALTFSPLNSLVKKLFHKESPSWIDLAPKVEADWNGCLQTLEGHSSWVKSVAISPDGRRLASGSHDKTVKLWDAESGACLETLEGHSNEVWSVAFSTDGRRLASSSYDNTVKLWDAESGNCLQTLVGHSSYVNSVTFSPDGRRLASSSYDETVKLWDPESGACLHTLDGHSYRVWSVAFSTDGHRLASGSSDNTVKLWDAESGACLQTLEGHSASVWSVAFSTDGHRLASGSSDNTVKLWDAESGTYLQTFKGHSNDVWSVAFSTNGRRLASGGDNMVKLWDAESGDCLQTLEGHTSWVDSVAFSTDGRRIASGSNDNTVKLWEAESGNCLQTLEGHSSYINSVAFSTDGRRLASGSYDRTVKLWDAESGTYLQTFKGHSASVRSVAFSTDGRRLASSSNDETVKLWDPESGACLQALEGHSASVRSVAFSTDGRRLASSSYDKTVKLWDPESGDCLQTLNVGRVVQYLSFYPDYHSRLLSDIGDIILDSSFMDLAPLIQGASSTDYNRSGYGISANRLWITYKGHNLIWLPPEYRRSQSRVTGSTVAIGCDSGRVWVMRFAGMELVNHK